MSLVRRRSCLETEPVINITPLIDVVFVILIAFIIVAPLLEKEQVELAQAGVHHESISMNDSSPIQIHVRADNTLLLNGVVVAFEDLTPQLIKIRQLYPQARPQVLHDKKAHFGTYQKLKNGLEQTGFEEMDIVLAPA